MAVNYATKYSAQVDERFKLASVTAGAVNQNYDFVGVKTVNVYTIPTGSMNDYKREGDNRYGTPEELHDDLQELTMKRDRSFSITVDKGNNEDQMNVKEAGKVLANQIDEVIVPEIDIYRIAAIAAGAGNVSAAAAITKDNAYEAFLDGINALTDAKAPMGGRIAYISPTFFKAIRLDGSFIKASDVAQGMLVKGQVGMIENIPLILVPTSYMPTNTAFIITNPIACCAPIKLADYKVHIDPPGLNGVRIEGRVYYDAFVLNNKKGAIYKHVTA